jgi:antitoxin CcdA
MQERVKSKKRAVNLSIDAELVSEAKAAGANMSALLERALKDELKQRRSEKLRAENRQAIQKHNQLVRKHGLLSDDWRKF